MTGWLILPLMALPWLSDAGPEGEVSPPEAPRAFAVSEIGRKIRAFRLVGDRLLVGEAAAYDARVTMARTVSSELAAADPRTWTNPRDAAALLEFVLFGGDAGALKAALASGMFAEALRPAAQGLLAYAERRLDLAKASLAETDTTALPDEIRHPLSLIQGTLLQDSDPELALTHFEEVRVAAPGTALEEAALRQQVLTLLRHEKSDRATDGVRLLTTYLRRYPSSIYWAQFGTLAAAAVAGSGTVGIVDLMAADNSITSAEASRRYRQLLADVSRAFLTAGDFARSVELAEFLVTKAAKGSDAWRRADLYRNVVHASRAGPDASLEALGRLDLSNYSDEERALIRVAVAVGRQIKAGYVANGAPVQTAASGLETSQSTAAKPPALQSAIDAARPLSAEDDDRIREVLAEADAALKKATP